MPPSQVPPVLPRWPGDHVNQPRGPTGCCSPPALHEYQVQNAKCKKKKRKGALRVWRHLLVEITHCSVDALVHGFMSSLLKDFFFNDQTVIHFCFHRFESALFGHYRLSQETDDQTKVFAVVGKKKDEVRTSAGHA